MSLPYEEDSDHGRSGEYDLSERSDEVRPLNIIPRRSVSIPQQEDHDDVNADDDEQPKKSLFHRICPGFITNIPSFILISFMVILVLFIVFSIPVIFALTYSSSSSAQQTETSDMPNPVDIWPVDPNNQNLTIDLAQLLPKNVSLCNGRGFSCANHPSILIGLNSVCDGLADCPDGSDETKCKECKTAFSCPIPGSSSDSFLMCLRAEALCNEKPHCADQSDVSLCTKSCSFSEFQCRSSEMCLPRSFLCDGENHCPAGEDELNCDGKCSGGSMWCESSKSCLPKWMLCNGKVECQDASDEQGCDCNHCSGDENALCKSSKSDVSGFCVNKAKICDGVKNCPGGQDEDECPGEVKSTAVEMIKCKDGKEYSKIYACLGLIPSCRGACDKCDEKFSFDCGNNHCILKSKKCDGKRDCENGSDELNCECPSSSTPTYQCASPLKNGKLKCIEKTQRCDGFIDCPGGDDEKGCSECSNEDAFKCKKQDKCISPTERCDGRKHCSDGSDEEDCSLEECAVHPFSMYMCNDGKTCFRNAEVCSPYSICPASTSVDKAFCAAFRSNRFRV